MAQAATSPITNSPEIVDLAKARKLRTLALALADEAAHAKSSEDRRRLEQAALRLWQAARRHSWPDSASGA
jgi:hypothetical protein